jgi:hypothetical protein
MLATLAGPVQTADALIRCRERPADLRYFAWREIDGKRCWFRGSRNTPKAMLFWGHDDDGRDRNIADDRGARGRDDARDAAPVNVTVPPWAPNPMTPIGEFERRWRELPEQWQ